MNRESAHGPKNIFQDLNSIISLRTIERWCKCIRETGGINLSKQSGMLKDDLGLYAYKVQTEPLLTDKHEEKRVRFANQIQTNFRKEDTTKILFLDEKTFDIDAVYNFQNDRIWAANRSEADIKGGIRQKRKFPQKIMVWLGV